VALAVVLAMAIPLLVYRPPEPDAPHELAQAEDRDAGTGVDGGPAGLGEEVLTAPVSSSAQPSSRLAVGLDMPRSSLPGQRRPNDSGQCPREEHIIINGGCWLALRDLQPPCGDDGYEWKGDCYSPVWIKQRLPTSDPP
jgi:hypothetical protein